MHIQGDQILSVTTNPDKRLGSLQELHDKEGSQFEISTKQMENPSIVVPTPRKQVELLTPTQRKCSILTAVIGVLLVGSVVVNIYLGVQMGKNSDVKDLSLNIDDIQWGKGCSDTSYQITVPHIGGKLVSMNITHWPECYYQLIANAPSTRLLQGQNNNLNSDNLSQNELDPQVGVDEPSNSKIWSAQNKISIVAAFI